MGLDTTPRTWTTAELVTAAMLNTEVRDALTGIQAAWTAYTPTWTAATTNPTLGNGTLVGSYLQVGNTVLWKFDLTFGSTTTAGSGNYVFTLPVTHATVTQGHPMGLATITNAGVKPGNANLNTGSTVYIVRASTETLISGAGAGAAWATGHLVSVTGWYEAA